jgi:hypothetical protein
MWRDELRKAAVPLLSVILGGVISIAAVFVQGRISEQRENLLTKKEKLETILSLALQVESGLNKMPALLASGSSGDRVDIAHQLRTMIMLSEVYFPALNDPANAYANRVVAALDGLVACEKIPQSDPAKRYRCRAAAVESVPTGRELEALFALARSQLRQFDE